MNDRLEGVSTFVQVVEAGSFALAAERLDLTRSAVGKAIARLGVRLLHRTTRNQSLTAEGQAYYERCLRALSELDAAEADLDQGRLEPTGRLRVSVPNAFGHFCVAPVLLGLMQKYPKLQVDLSFSDRRVDLVEEGFDLAIRVGDLSDTDTLTARSLCTQHISIGASPTYLAAHGTPSSIEDLDGHTGIGYSRAGALAPWDAKAADGRSHLVRIQSRISMDDIQAIASAAIDGVGLAWLPCWLLARYVRSGQLVAVMNNYRVRSQEIYAVWPTVRHLRCKTRVAVDALVAEVPGLMDA
ncbi:DNA-binding transcriptional LysR family regulator [Luteibacter sp. Sphag1AF]|uniref:LysR family transcriptional regulator n=1 Tax=Luteibacter sp. Sphag1AF TaxID=2587031 RepID=UPI00161D61EB|nr:LysR family transcriptional regulator [Luteibacter sp. Sphag1AF]MBB3228669.1 DNA-binding transcriptional LysR family regulator [Luteibacter sp. Sphag1AF]